MSPTSATTGKAHSVDRPRAGYRWIAGITRTGIAIVVIAALINALRRSIIRLQGDPFDEWIVEFLTHLGGSLVIAAVMLVAVVFAVHMYPNKGTRQYAAIAAAILASSGAAWALVLTLERALDSIHLGGVSLPELSLWEEFLPGSLRYAVIGGLIAGAWLYFRAEEEGAAAAHQCDVEAAQLEAQAAQARLQVLEAQIEPHFLFNVLATVRRLYETDTETGDRMLGNLMRYLTIALPQMRLSGSTLAREVALADAYLDLQSIRMGRRLTYGIEIPPSLRDASMPSLMLSTLVENAIKHGIAPLPAGGSIAITAREENGLLRVDVTDTGRGFVETAGGGTGLANIRARLAGQFGRDGRLMLSRVEPHGVSVSIVLPLSMATASATTT